MLDHFSTCMKGITKLLRHLRNHGSNQHLKDDSTKNPKAEGHRTYRRCVQLSLESGGKRDQVPNKQRTVNEQRTMERHSCLM